MTLIVMCLVAMAATAPWWTARAAVERRAARIAGAGPPPWGLDAGVRRLRYPWGARPEPIADGPIDIGVLLGLIAAAVRAGVPLPRALHAVGHAVGDEDGAALGRVATALVMGASWSAAWIQAPSRLKVVRDALRPAWEHGTAPAEALQIAASQLRTDRQAVAAQSAARLGVRLVLPLGACYLPAFVFLGLVPLLLSLGSGFLS